MTSNNIVPNMTPNTSTIDGPTLPADCTSNNLILRSLINADYQDTHNEMLQITLDRIDKKRQGIITPDQLWVVEHNDVYTLGQAGKEEHILQRGTTPIIHTDRGGQVTWHGTGQLVVYWLIDLQNTGWSVRDLVSHAEQSIEDVLNKALSSQPSGQEFYAKSRRDAPGVYIYNQDDVMLGKIASLGFKIKHGFSYHGIALNLNCDLAVFNSINPCGYAGMQMLKLADFVDLDKVSSAASHPDNLSQQGLQIIEGSVSELGITHQLIKNIMQRESGDIALRALQSNNEK